MFKIEKGIPIPKSNKTGGSKYMFDKMNIGDSFFIEAKEDARKKQTAVINAANIWRKRNNIPGFKIKTHLYEDGIRVWRVK